MKWAYPLEPATITGKQILTGDKPVTAIYRAVKELQDAVVAAASLSINGVPFSVRIVGNKLVADVQIDVGGSAEDVLPAGTEANQVLVWNGSIWVADNVRAI